MHNVINAQKDAVFRIRMNAEVKSELEEVFAKNGLTLTDAVNVFPVPGRPSIRILRRLLNPYFCSLFRFRYSMSNRSIRSWISEETTKSESRSEG